jgi:hypothetical protein
MSVNAAMRLGCCFGASKWCAMRTVFIFPTCPRGEAATRLDRLTSARAGDQSVDEWTMDDVLWIRVRDRVGALYDDWDLKIQAALSVANGGELPDWAVIVDVSGRVTGEAEVRRVVSAVAGTGLVVDDQADVIWNAAEVAAGDVAYGWAGFHRV